MEHGAAAKVGERDMQMILVAFRTFRGVVWAPGLDWRRIGLLPPNTVSAAVEEYKQAEDRFASFIADCCVTVPGARGTSKDLYAAYRDWATANGEYVATAKAFGQRLADRGYTPTKLGKSNDRGWLSIGRVTTSAERI